MPPSPPSLLPFRRSSLPSLLQQLPDRSRVVRVMPNTPCLVGQSAAAFAMGDNCLPEDAALVKKIFSAVGAAFEVKEKDLNGTNKSMGGWVGGEKR